MPKRPMSNRQKKTIFIAIQYCLIFVLVSVIAHIIVAAQFEVSPHDGLPDYDTPWRCSSLKYKSCTTREGKCTFDKRQCVYPESNEQCTYFMLVKELTKYQRKRLISLYQNITLRQQRRKILQQYCANKALYIYESVSEDLFTPMLAFEVLLSLALLAIFYAQISQIAHKIAYN